MRLGNHDFQILLGRLPTEEQLRTEIERQKQLFMMQHEGNNKEEQ